MTRPASNIDIEMIKAGRMIIETEGVESVTIRRVCSLASVNTGLFNYYFATKENFFIKLLDHIYNELCEVIKYDIQIVENNSEEADPLYRIRCCLNKILEFVVDKEKLIISIFYDVLLKNKDLLESVESYRLSRHIMINLIEECIKAKYFSTKLPPAEIFAMFIMGGFCLQHSSFSSGYDIESTEKRASLRKERVNIILNGLLNKGGEL